MGKANASASVPEAPFQFPGAHLRRIREAAGVPLRTLAPRLGLSIPTLSRWETNGRPIPADLAERWRTELARLAVERARAAAAAASSLLEDRASA